MNRNLKIAIYSGEIPSTTFIERLIEGLSAKGHLIYLFGVKKRSVTYSKKIKVLGYQNSKLLKAFFLIKYSLLLSLQKPKAKKKLDTFLKREDRDNLYSKVKYYPVLYHEPQIFHIQWAKALDEWLWVQDFGIKLVLSLRGAHINYSPIASSDLTEMYCNNFPKVDGFHAVSKAIAQEAIQYNAPNDKIKVVYSGLDIKPSSMRKNDSPVFKIISIGRPHWIKGYTCALDCCYLLKQAGFNFEYTIVGGNGSIELKYQIMDLGLENEVTLLETLPFSSVKEKVENSNLLLLSSIKEGVANVVLEAMALGVPVLTTDCGGMTEVINDNFNGFVCPTRNPKAMTNKIVEISKMPKESLAEIITNAQETISKNHKVEYMVSGMEDFYNLVSNSFFNK